MTNNEVLRSIRYLLNVNEAKLVEIFALADCSVSVEDVTAFLLREEDPGYRTCSHGQMARFLNGLIYFKRGKDPARPAPPLDVPVSNNSVLKKLRVAFTLKDTDIIAKIEKSGQTVTKAELGAFFRDPAHRNYRECGDQFLRYLLRGLG